MFTEWRMKVECEGFTDPVEEENVEESPPESDLS